MRRARMSILLPSILLILIAATSVSGQPAPPTIDVTKLGPQAGERVADFRLQDQDGKVWTRDALMGPNGLMLVFLRSADW
jgi:cytochrome oxidase Cu insertion factor (SCO1/SenC/PrrC family)